MCGITGVFLLKKNNNFDINSLKNMTNSMTHRGPDSFGYWSSDSKNVFLGHRRLSIVDLSKHGDQPMTSSCGRYVIVFNGEIYNYKNLSVELINKFNIKLKNKTDTIVLLELISKFGLRRTLEKLEGMFAFCLWDKKKKNFL